MVPSDNLSKCYHFRTSFQEQIQIVPQLFEPEKCMKINILFIFYFLFFLFRDKEIHYIKLTIITLIKFIVMTRQLLHDKNESR